jgi:hypothetical protein
MPLALDAFSPVTASVTGPMVPVVLLKRSRPAVGVPADHR